MARAAGVQVVQFGVMLGVVTSLGVRTLYCDESRTDGGGPFYFGALECSPARAEILRDGLRAAKAKHGCTGEMKWTKVSPKMVHVYEDFVDVFGRDKFARFAVMKVERSPAWYDWGRTEEERYFKSCYAFLRRMMGGYSCSRCNIHLDSKQARPWRWSSLKFALRNAAARDGYAAGRRAVPSLVALDSKSSELIQLVDVVLGGFTAQPTAPAKTSLKRRIGAMRSVYTWTFDFDPAKARAR